MGRACTSLCVGVGGWVRFEPCVLPKMSLFPCHHVVSDCVCVQRTLWFQTPFYCYCAHKCATQQLGVNCELISFNQFHQLQINMNTSKQLILRTTYQRIYIRVF